MRHLLAFLDWYGGLARRRQVPVGVVLLALLAGGTYLTEGRLLVAVVALLLVDLTSDAAEWLSGE